MSLQWDGDTNCSCQRMSWSGAAQDLGMNSLRPQQRWEHTFLSLLTKSLSFNQLFPSHSRFSLFIIWGFRCENKFRLFWVFGINSVSSQASVRAKLLTEVLDQQGSSHKSKLEQKINLISGNFPQQRKIKNIWECIPLFILICSLNKTELLVALTLLLLQAVPLAYI